MIRWEHRPLEVAYLLNPAFCGEILCRCIKRYQAESTQHFPYSLSYLVLPIILHKNTRETIPTGTRKHMHVWIQENQQNKVGFSERTKSLVDITRESISFLLQIKALSLDNNGLLYMNEYTPRESVAAHESEVLECLKKSEIIGLWFSRSGSPTTIFAMFGVIP